MNVIGMTDVCRTTTALSPVGDAEHGIPKPVTYDEHTGVAVIVVLGRLELTLTPGETEL
jgi:hypothetical protein